MRRLLRHAGTALVVLGLGTLAGAGVVWQWQDPVTAVYTHLEQRGLAGGYEERLASFTPRPRAAEGEDVPVAELRDELHEEASAYRAATGTGDPVGRLLVPRLGLEVVVVEGTDDETLRRGPGRYSPSAMPGEGELVYVAGHRTTYSAPFARIDELRPGDAVVLEVPYGRFEYRITGHEIVEEDALEVLESRGREELVLQACHPRFFASHRYIARAEPVSVTPTDGPRLDAAALASR
jgi:sortase A